jgi:aryl-alcohol dehydrogenase-like predicted oxidoreductase
MALYYRNEAGYHPTPRSLPQAGNLPYIRHTMEYRPLGPTGIRVSEICLGTMQFKWTTSEAQSYRVLDHFFAEGGNFVDSADIYSFWAKGCKGGESETIIGKWMARHGNRRQVVLATKAHGRMWPGATGEGLGRAHLVQACEDSLKRLRTDYIDLYQSHSSDSSVPIEETLKAYDDLIRAGKVRNIGCSNYTSGEFAEALAVSRAMGLPQYVSIQPYYHPMARDFEKDHAWLCRKYSVSVIPYSPLSGGFFTGKYRRNRPVPKTERARGLKWLMNDKGWKTVETLERLGRKRGKTVAQMALGWHLSHDWMTAPIIGANTVKQLSNLLGAAGLKLTPEEVKAIEKAGA